MNNKTTRKQRAEQHTRHTILISSVAILQTYGLKKFTMDKVAEQAGIAKGTLYLYFKNKNELLLSVANHCFEPLNEDMRKIFSSEISILEKLKKYLSASFLHTEQNRALFYELKAVLLTHVEKDFNDKNSTYWEMINIVARTFEDGVKKKLLRPMDCDKVAIFFIDSIDRAMARRIFTKVDDSAEDDARELLNIYLHGLAL
ncbi:TetR/AcrR family transcriptional regulator [Halodesulfovibrio marinisediminis]|uniref:Transcriptional regulator, TetR family n=1 Tax=Halodesulfovibrio marinisediminis DSM 17456 TaxID=1121457 RepID=A0A1N6GQZ2_9BACT|nr:TetR/AcrR family transcriptional regulator [Halodesulfovibrio marinisediminis]SIO09907.1 transcriptional regulator, TetR family [Halodesulfovibrio marinisediminis DSM 17456]